MTDKVHPSIKPTTNGGVAPPATTAIPMKSQPYNPTFRPPPPYRHQRRRSRCHFSCCCCFIWTTICILSLILIASIVGCLLYVLYHPKEPTFTISSLRVATLNVTSSADSSSSHLDTFFNMTITAKNPNSHVAFSFMPFSVSAVSDKGVQVGNGTLDDKEILSLSADNATTVRVMLSASRGLDAESALSLRSDLRNKKKGLSLKIMMDTEVKVMIEKIKSKMVGIRVTCDGIKGVVAPSKATSKGKAPPPVVANTAGAKCKVDLRIKIWNWRFTF